MGFENDKNLQKRQTAAIFINTTQQMMEAEGLDNISIRKIAERAGFHNSTIYLYFKDLDELLMLASMKHFHDYSQSLEKLSQETHTTLEIFILIWDLFFENIFRRPEIFYNFFFGKRSDNLQKIMKTYYEVFPEELNIFSSNIESMYFGNNIQERSLRILEPLIAEDTAVTTDNLHMINDILISCCKYKLEQKCKVKDLDTAQLISELKNIIYHVCGISK